VAVALVFGEFVGKDKFIKDAGCHEDGFTCSHGEGKDVVGVVTGVGAKLSKNLLILLFGKFLENIELDLTSVIADGAPLEFTCLLCPFSKDALDRCVIQILFKKDIDFQCLKLWLTQEGFGVVIWVVVVKELFSEVTVVGADSAPILLVKVMKLLKESKVEVGLGGSGASGSRHD